MSTATLANLIGWRDFQQTTEGNRLFPSAHSLAWFIRQHEIHLVEAGVLVKVRNQWHLARPDFDQVVMGILRESAIQDARANACSATAAPEARESDHHQ